MRFNWVLAVAMAALSLPVCAAAADKVDTDKEKIDYTPKIHGVIRTRYEAETDPDWRQRFQVRNARLSVEGLIMRDLSYYIRFDACDRGKMKFLDGWARWQFAPQWRVQAGQMRVPFGVACFRGPGTYIFPNRSFMVKNMVNVRQVGVTIGWYGTEQVPLTIETGVYNSRPMGDHEVWQDAMDFAAKAVWRLGPLSLSGSFLTMKPSMARMNVVDGAAMFRAGRWYAEAEYQHEHYVGGGYRDVNAWDALLQYSLPLHLERANVLSFQGRFDGMTDHSTGTPDADGKLITNDPARRRLTLGTTLGYVRKPVKAEVTVNYEKYFYNSGVSSPKGAGDKIVAELIVKF